MGLTCARLNCGESAAASVQFDAEGSRVILIDLTDRTYGIPVCRAHARTRTAPMGWTLTDQRTVRVHQQAIWDAVSARSRTKLELVERHDAPIIEDPADPFVEESAAATEVVDTEAVETDAVDSTEADLTDDLHELTAEAMRGETTAPLVSPAASRPADPRFEWQRMESTAPVTTASTPLLARAFRTI